MRLKSFFTKCQNAGSSTAVGKSDPLASAATGKYQQAARRQINDFVYDVAGLSLNHVAHVTVVQLLFGHSPCRRTFAKNDTPYIRHHIFINSYGIASPAGSPP